MEPLEGLDAAFLALEAGATRLHIAAALVLDPPEGRRSLFSPSTRFAQIRRVIAERVHLAPPLRQRAVRVPLGLHHPVWVDDPEFDLDDHVLRASLPEPGDDGELARLVAEIVARPLDPDRPLWEMVVVEGLAGGRTAVVAKLHHAILDGVSGASLMAAFFDLGPRPRLVEPAPLWRPAPLPSQAQLLRHAVGSLGRQPKEMAETVQRTVNSALGVSSHNRRLAGDGLRPPPAPFSAPRTSINGTISSRRRYATASLDLGQVKMVGRACGATVNDVLLACVAGGLRRLLAARGEEVGRPLVALVPVSTRQVEERHNLGNRVSAMLVSLATTEDNPVRRLEKIVAASLVAKAQEQLAGGRLLAQLTQVTSPAVTSRAAKWTSGLRLFDRVPPVFNVVVSSMVGPDVTLFCAGSRVVRLHPVGPVVEGSGLNVTAMTYLNQLQVGLLACRRLVPEVADLALSMEAALDELVGATLGAQGATG
ncbi:MAG TPA: wax ester/triacylglycerol synthase family O-acyltransferase [Acidimicrobiales bacterium]|nr:wax ester/triacylglycerol synthase family O-acyltransferase [Acidimicrobiales bacterium]